MFIVCLFDWFVVNLLFALFVLFVGWLVRSFMCLVILFFRVVLARLFVRPFAAVWLVALLLGWLLVGSSVASLLYWWLG